MRSNPGLWKRLNAHRLDATEGSSPFSVKLARAEGWSARDTARVIEEYRRFLYLVRARGLDPVPPPPIDAAWTTHLTYTRNYWDQLVPDVLQSPLHRDAARDTDARARRAAHRAFATAYREEFSEPAPADIWTDPAKWTFGGWVGVLMITGVLGGFLSFFAMWLVALITGADLGDNRVDTAIERAGVGAFMVCWTMAFFSPLWAWLLTRGQARLKSSKPASGVSGIEVSFSRSAD